MVRSWWFYLKYSSFFRNADNGLKAFAERCMNALISSTAKKLQSNRQKRQRLLVEKQNRDARAEEIASSPMLDNDEYFSVKRKIYGDTFIWIAIVVAEIFLNYVSTLIFIPGEEPLFALIRWTVAIVVTGSAVLVADKLLEAAIVVQRYKTQTTPSRSYLMIAVLSIFLSLVEVAIIGISEARAKDIEGQTRNVMLYYGFIVLSMVLPLIAGWAIWDKNRYIDAYKNTKEHRRILRRITEIDAALQTMREHESLFYKAERTGYWDTFVAFQTYKEVYNQKRKFHEDLATHFSRSHDAFEDESDKRYESDIHEHVAERIVKLERTDTAVGSKVGQSGLAS